MYWPHAMRSGVIETVTEGGGAEAGFRRKSQATPIPPTVMKASAKTPQMSRIFFSRSSILSQSIEAPAGRAEPRSITLLCE
jgi:hypothetical protein